jgi:hypothetical protein
MAKKTELTITIEGKKGQIPYSSFIAVFNNAVGLLNSIAKNIEQTPVPDITWVITKIQMASPLTVTFAGRSRKRSLANSVIRDYVLGTQQIQEKGELPRHFAASDIDLMSKMVGVLNDDIHSLSIGSPRQGKVQLTRHLAVNVQRIQRHLYHYEYTFFRGRLNDILTSHGAHEFVIRDLLTDKSITCIFPPEEHEKVGTLLLKRVEVHGKAKFTRKGEPISIEVADFDALPETSLKISEAAGIDITGGMDAVDYVRKIRNGETI